MILGATYHKEELRPILNHVALFWVNAKNGGVEHKARHCLQVPPPTEATGQQRGRGTSRPTYHYLHYLYNFHGEFPEEITGSTLPPSPTRVGPSRAAENIGCQQQLPEG